MAIEDSASEFSRAELWSRLDDESFDVLVIGGGINGAGIARDAALRGLKTALVEKGDFGSGTSFRSSKLIHGGLRYLETYQFGLVRESTAERAVQMRMAPHLARPLPFMFPVYKEDPHGLLFMDMGLWLYDALALFRVPKIHRAMRENGVLAREPELKKEGLVGGLHYYDCSTDDGRLTLENILDAISLGAVCVNHASVDSLIKSTDGKRIIGAGVTDGVSGKSVEVRARMVIVATGAWTDSFLSLAGENRPPLVRATRGSHVVVPRAKLPVKNAVAMLSPADNRPLFVIPWGDHTYVGTTDVEHSEGPDCVFIHRDEVDYIMEAIKRYFPGLDISENDVTGTWSGLRPLVDEPDVATSSKISREHEIIGGEDGLLILVGGKLTTYRLMARQTLDRALHILSAGPDSLESVRKCATKNRPLPGGVGLSRGQLDVMRTEVSDKHAVSGETAEHLLSVYGSRVDAVLSECGKDDIRPLCPGLHHVRAEVDFAVRYEMAATLEDVMIRRTLIGLKEAENSLKIAGSVAAGMAEILNWDEAEKDRQIAAYRKWVENSLEALSRKRPI